MVFKKNVVLLKSALVFIVLFIILKQLSFLYESYATRSYNLSIEKQLISKGSALKEVIDSRFALLKGLNSYVTTTLNLDPSFFDKHNELTETFVKALYENASGIKNISIAKNAIQSYVYPINKKVLSHNLLADKRSNVVKNVQKAINTKEPVLDGPYELRQGGLGIILRIAVFNNDKFWGIVAMVVDASKLFLEVDMLPTNPQYTIVARNINKNIILGFIPEEKIEPITYRVKLYDKYIDLFAYPKNSQYISNLSFFINIIILIISSLFSYVVYILISRDEYLKKEIQKASLELEKKEAVLTSVFMAIPDLLFIMNKDGLIIDYKAKNNSHMYMSPDKFMGKPMVDILPQNVGELFKKNIEGLSDNSTLNVFKYELKIEEKVLHFEARMAPLPIGDHIMTIIRDVSEQVLDEQKLMLQSKQLKSIIQDAPNPMILHEEGGKVLMLNQAWVDASGFSVDEIRTIDDWIENTRDDEEVITYMKKHIGSLYEITEKLDEGEFTFLNKNRDVLTWQVFSAPLGKINGKRTIITSAMDITELKHRDAILEETVESRTQELKKTINNLKNMQKQLVESEKIASLGSLVAGVAHEINTPIGIGVTGITHLLVINKEIVKKYKSNSLSKEEFDKFIETSNDLANVININLSRAAELIKSFKKIAIDRTSEEKREFNVKDYINEVLISLQSITKKTKHEFTIDCLETLIINSYPGLFSQVITNFIMNSIIHAFKDNKTGHIRIVVEKENNMLIINYKDNGSGISKENLPKIFDPFFTTNRKGGGSGLGLNIVHNIVTYQLKGTISAKSVVSKGIEFNLEIPI